MNRGGDVAVLGQSVALSSYTNRVTYSKSVPHKPHDQEVNDEEDY